MKHGHNLIIYFVAADFDRLMSMRATGGKHLIKPGITLEDSWLELTDTSARLHVTYRGMKPDGRTPHQRRTRDVITFPAGAEGFAWLRQLIPDPAERLNVGRFWPEANLQAAS